ncbi:hypothetical protein [Pantoea sp. AV62]|uniref:hypothetical protein n=1 Tax=Pantoea sp. AV62 TaxID=1990688 RepID=UPI00117E5AF9|nr:hypothetical protein [Pantoea sp. AV62]
MITIVTENRRIGWMMLNPTLKLHRVWIPAARDRVWMIPLFQSCDTITASVTEWMSLTRMWRYCTR